MCTCIYWVSVLYISLFTSIRRYQVLSMTSTMPSRHRNHFSMLCLPPNLSNRLELHCCPIHSCITKVHNPTMAHWSVFLVLLAKVSTIVNTISVVSRTLFAWQYSIILVIVCSRNSQTYFTGEGNKLLTNYLYLENKKYSPSDENGL